MKCRYVTVLADGMADEPCSELGGQTPLQYARTPNMDFLAGAGEMGTVRSVPPGYSPGSDVANLSVMGYDPRVYYTGRSPLEAVSMGIELTPEDVAYRCNLVTLSGEAAYAEKTMVDYCAGEISSGEARELVELLNQKLAGKGQKFYPGISYRHLMVWNGGSLDCTLTPPHDISGRKIGEYLPAGAGSETLLEIMQQSHELLKDHPVNTTRVEKSQNPANSAWLWGEGKKPALTAFKEKFGLNGAVISAVDLIKGIGTCAGMEVLEVEGATGNVHTNFRGKAEAALEGLQRGLDFVYIHLEAPDEAAHQGDLQAKIRAIEEIDQKVLGELIKSLPGEEGFKIMVLPDHPTPMRTKTHSADPVPFVIYDSRRPESSDRKFNENTARNCPLQLEEGHTLMDYFINPGS